MVNSLSAVVGAENVASNSLPALDGHDPIAMASPGSHDEAVACLRVCAEFDASVIPAGRLSWFEWGNPLTSADVILSVNRMNRVIDYSPADLTGTFEAGVGFARFDQLTRQSGQWLPLDPSGVAEAALGAIAACGLNGSLRYGFGAVRDYVIGLRLAHADGSESKCGGRVVKNVAGYDMTKLYVGSYGTLAVITEVTVKLRPLPQRQATLAISGMDEGALFDLGARVIRSNLQPASAFLVSGAFRELRGSERGVPRLLIRFMDTNETVNYQISRVREMLNGGLACSLLDDEQGAVTWAALAGFDQDEEVVVRLNVPVSSVGSVLHDTGRNRRALAADLAMGIIRMSLEERGAEAVAAIESLRSALSTIGGRLFIERSPLAVRRQVDSWGDPGPAGILMQSVKEKFDHKRVLNPGRFVRGI